MAGPGGNTGSGTVRGRGRARGNQSSRGGSQGPPLAAQLRQLDRLNEPEEVTLMRRYKDLGVLFVRSLYGPTGLVERQLQIQGEAGAKPAWISVKDAEMKLAERQASKDMSLALNRREARLGAAKADTPWAELSSEERRILFLSQKEYNSFRDSKSGVTSSTKGKEKEPEVPAPKV